jgi:hypothetical protein
MQRVYVEIPKPSRVELKYILATAERILVSQHIDPTLTV